MPAIPQYQQRTQASGGLGAGPTAPASAGIGEGLQMLGHAMGGVEDAWKQAEDRSAATAATEELSNAQETWLTELDSRKQNASSGAPDFTSSLLKDYNQYSADALSRTPNPKAQAFLKERLNAFRGSLQRESIGFEAASRVDHAGRVMSDSIDSASNELQNNPERFTERLAERRALIEGQSQNPKQYESTMAVAQRKLSYFAVNGLVDKDPKATLKALNAEVGKSGVTAVDALHAEDRVQLRNSAEAEIHRRDALARQLADHREAIAERAFNAVDRQIQTGVPLTASMWADANSKIAGTSMASEFGSLVASERDTQALLRKPIDEQLRTVQERTASLDTNGGSLREAANLQRLRTAVQQNVTTLQQAPLLFNANRTGQQPQPFDVSQLGSEEGQQSAAGVLRDRVDTITAMRKQYGNQVSMRPLLPQEQAQLTSMVSAGTPAQLSRLFADLHKSLGNDEAYMAAMQQIAPDSPVRAFAGVLSARQATATLEHHWFKPDVVAQSGDVSGTILAGEAILSPGKTASGADGKPKVGLYLPETNTLQQQFQDTTGDAFSGHPEAAQVAFQVVKAYYVGKAAKVGRLASDKSDIDSAIVKEAISATLGEVVDVNGRGKVIAPWGMGADDFQSAARAAFDAQKGQIGSKVSFDSLGLKAAGPNAYYLSTGRSYLVDSKGAPIVLSIDGKAKK